MDSENAPRKSAFWRAKRNPQPTALRSALCDERVERPHERCVRLLLDRQGTSVLPRGLRAAVLGVRCTGTHMDETARAKKRFTRAPSRRSRHRAPSKARYVLREHILWRALGLVFAYSCEPGNGRAGGRGVTLPSPRRRSIRRARPEKLTFAVCRKLSPSR